jgi:hypothetical protein
MHDDGGTGATLSGVNNGTLNTTATTGKVIVKATITDGIKPSCADYVKYFEIEVTAVPQCVPVTNITGIPSTIFLGVPATLNGIVQPNNADVQAPIVWSVKSQGTTGASITGNTLKTTASGTVTVTATITNGKCGTDYTQDFVITVGCAQGEGQMHWIRDVSTRMDTMIICENHSPSSEYNPQVHQLKAWVLYNHNCGEININVLENNTLVGSKSIDESTNDHITIDDCGDLIIFSLPDLSSSSQPSLDFKFYLLAKAVPCSGSPTSAPPVDGKSLTKGAFDSPVVYDYGLSADGTLPISLLNFSGSCHNGQVVLNWKTATETNNDYFTIERGEANGNSKIRWANVAEIKGAGNSSMPLSYSYTDYANNTNEKIYYRLKQTDYNGQYEYFTPIVVNCPKSKEDIKIYPNRTNGILYIQTATNAPTDFRLYSVEGRLLKNGNGTEVDLLEYAKGVYFLKVNNTTFKVVKE